MIKPLKDLVPPTTFTAKAKTGDVLITASRSERPPTLSFAEQFRRFVRYAQHRTTSFTVDTASRPIVTTLLAYFLRDNTVSKERYQFAGGLISDGLNRLR